MSRLMRLFCFVLLAGTVQAQGGFSRFHFLPGVLDATANDVMETPDHKYLICGRTYAASGNEIISRLTLLCTELNGDTLWSKNYGNVSIDYPDYFQRNQFFCSDSNNFYVWCTGREPSGHVFATLFKLNYAGDTIWHRKYIDTAANVVPQVIIRAIDGGFYTTAYYMPNDGERPILLMRISENGDLVWKKIINKPAPNVMSGSDMIQDPATGRLIITGYQYIGANFATYSSVFFLDSLGNKVQHKYYNNACGGAAGRIVNLDDGHFLTSANQSINCNTGLYQCQLFKIDIDGNQIWKKTLAPAGYLNSIHPISQKKNGDIIALGGPDSNYIRGFKYTILDKEGNIKSTMPYGRVKDVFSHDGGRGGSRTSDGGYITAVQLVGEPSPTPFYIIKLDSMGCDTTPENCEWERTVALKEQQQTLQAEVFPNPCNETLNIGVAEGGYPAEISVFDHSGRVLRQEEMNLRSHTLNTAQLSPGLYLLEVRSRSGGMFRRNFVVGRQ